MALKTSDNGIDFLKTQEGCLLTSYKLPGETYYTIGYGHYGADVYEGMTITEQQAEDLLRSDLVYYENGVNEIAVSKFPSINQNQFDALVSYAYNRGLGNSSGTNGLRQLVYNSSTIEELGNNFPVYWGSAETYKDSLIARRKREQELFNTPVEGGGTTDNSSIINAAVNWCLEIAADDSHGYDQTNRWGPDYDCSSLLIQAWENAGVPVKTNGASYTGNMVDVFKQCGFTDVTSQVNLSSGSGIIKGDIVWKTGHTEMCSKPGSLVGAHINEFGEVTGGVTGDQTGREIYERTYYNSPWTTVLRFPSSSSGGNSTPDGGLFNPRRNHFNFLLLANKRRQTWKSKNF